MLRALANEVVILSFVFWCLCGELAAQSLTRWPYLQLGGETTVTIVWNTSSDADGEVEYGTSAALGSSQRDSAPAGEVHVVRLRNLRPDTEYHYRIRSGNRVLRDDLTFRTFPSTSCSVPFRFAAWGDSGTGEEDQADVANRIGRLDPSPDLAVLTGDLVYNDGEAENFNPRFFEPYEDLLPRMHVFPSLGNHDVRTAEGAPYLEAFYLPSNNPEGTERYYSFDYGNVHFVAVDTAPLPDDFRNGTTPFDPGTAQHTWLDRDLRNSDAEWKVVFHHHNPYTAGETHADDEINDPIREHLGSLYDRHSVDLVLVGHTHAYERTFPIRGARVVDDDPGPRYDDPPGTIYITAGGGGRRINRRLEGHENNDFQVVYAAEFHVVVVDVEGNRLTGEAVSPTGEVLDTFTIRKSPLTPAPEDDCDQNGVADACELLEGSDLDCDEDGVPDACELTDGAADCNGNGVPDSCELADGAGIDCDGNGVLDSCDLADGGANDCNENGIPDSCDVESRLLIDCDRNRIPDVCEIAAGTAMDCNGNGLLDGCDIATGLTPDCNGNGIPDACDLAQETESDCDGGGVPDACELAGGVVDDCDGNGVPDLCDLADGAGDCNANGVVDSCDLAGGASQDLNENQVPDECEVDCNGNGRPDDADLASGEFSDCNENRVPDGCDLAAGLADCNADGILDVCQEDCDQSGVLDACEVANGVVPDCNQNGVPDACDVAAGAEDVNGNGVPDTCDGDCNGNDVPDDVELTSATDCDANGRLDICNLAENPDLDRNSNGIPDSCDSSAVVRLEPRPDPVVNEAGTQAVALVSTLSADISEDILWEGAVFRDVGDGVLADLVRAARLVLDSNGDGRPDPDEEVIGTSEGDFADERIVFGNLSRRIAAGDTSRYLLVLDLDTDAGTGTGTGAGVRLGRGAVVGPPPRALPLGAVGWLAVLAFLALTLSSRVGLWSWLGGGDSSWFAAHRRRLHLTVPTLAALVLAAAMLPLGCSSGGGGGGGGSQGQPAVARTLQLELIEVEATGADSGDASIIDGLPLTAWEFEA